MKKKDNEVKIRSDIKRLQKKSKSLRSLRSFSNHEKKPSTLSYVKNLFDLGNKKVSIEDTIDFKTILEDGICVIDNNTFSKMLRFSDTNYELESEEVQKIIFNQYANLLNSFDASVSVELFFVNQLGNKKELWKSINVKDKQDKFDYIIEEFRNMLKNQLVKGNNGVKKDKYIIVTVKEKNYSLAKIKLERVTNEIFRQFREMDVSVDEILGSERAKILHRLLNRNKELDVDIRFSKAGIKKELVLPDKINFINKNYFILNDSIASIGTISITANELSDRFLSDILALNNNLYVSIKINAIEQQLALKMIKQKYTDVQKQVIEAQKKALTSGYDIDIIPDALQNAKEATKDLLDDLQNRDEKLFEISINVMAITESYKNNEQALRELENVIDKLVSLANKNNCIFKPADYRQEELLNETIGLGINKSKVKRFLTTSSTAVFIPFTTKELFQTTKESFYYGLNALSNNLIMADRKLLKNPNGLILGTPGSGKSFAAKREIANSFLLTDDDIIICDPEGEYGALVSTLDGTLIKLSAKSTDYLNPLDINANYGDGDSPLKDKSNFIINLLELVVGKSGLTAIEKSVIDRCIPKIYEKYFNNPKDENLPILQDLYEMLKKQGDIGIKLSEEMEIYVTGSLNVFNHHTTVDLNKRIICFDIKELGSQLKKIGMFILQDQVWNKVSANRISGKQTRYYVDEFHLLLKEKQTAEYSVEIWKRFRKWGGVPTGITQNVKDFLASSEIGNIFDNTDFILMLNQSNDDMEILSKRLKISKYQEPFAVNVNAGEGLIYFGKNIIPFIDRFPKNTTLYKIMTTKLSEQVD